MAVSPGRNLATNALGYATNQEAELRRILDSGDLLLDNTRAERALRNIVVGRKNWMRVSTNMGHDTRSRRGAAPSTSPDRRVLRRNLWRPCPRKQVLRQDARNGPRIARDLDAIRIQGDADRKTRALVSPGDTQH